MKKTLYSLAMLATVAIALSCDKECGCVNISGIRGDWEWIESTGGFGGGTFTPATEMITKSLKIDKTHYEEYRNDTLILRSEYEIVVTPDSSWGTNAFLEFESGESVAFIQEGTTLTLIELCFDCYTHRYERK